MSNRIVRGEPRRRKRRSPALAVLLLLLMIALVLLIILLLRDLFAGAPHSGISGSSGSIIAPSFSQSAPSSDAAPVGGTGEDSSASSSGSPASEPSSEPSSASSSLPPASEINTDPDAESTDPSSWNMLLVNIGHPLPDNYEPDLIQPSWSNYRVDARIVDEVNALYDAAKEDGFNLVLVSAYRGMARQTVLYEEKVTSYQNAGMSRKEAEAEAAKLILPPGTSEHHTGLALDVVCDTWYNRYAGYLDATFADYASAEWLADNCTEFGFILRYPSNKTLITGVDYEPWHFRYVGKEAAKQIMSSGICLEEYLGVG